MNKTKEQSAHRKHFAVPEFHIIELSSNDIICTSPYNDGFVQINGGDGILMDDEDWN